MSTVLTVRQPWATAIVHRGKDVENRVWPTRYRGPLVIHAAGSLTRRELDAAAAGGYHPGPAPEHGDLELGVVLGQVDVVDCHTDAQCVAQHGERRCSPWAMPDHHHWVLAAPRPLAPHPVKGRLGLWTLTLEGAA